MSTRAISKRRNWATTQLRGLLAWPSGGNITRSRRATTFDIFYWLQITNFDVLLHSAPSGPDYIDILGLCFHALSPLSCSSFIAGLERAKNRAGKCPPPDSDPFITGTKLYAK